MSKVELFHLGIKALITDTSESILLLKVNLEELSGYQGEAYWDIPGGRVHQGDSMLDTLRREVEEETGIRDVGEPVQLGTIQSNIRVPIGDGDVALALVIYRVLVAERPTVRLSSEHVEWAWVEKPKAVEMLTVKYPPEFGAVL